MEASQRSDALEIFRWLKRLAVPAISPELQKALFWTSRGFVAAGKPFDPCVAALSRAARPRTEPAAR